MATGIPSSHLDLFQKKAIAYLGTAMKDGAPQVSPVWVDYDGEFILVNTARGRIKEINMSRRPQVGMTIQDPDQTYRYLLIQGRVAGIVEDADGARDHINRMSLKYDETPFSFTPGEIRRLFKIRPEKVVAGG